MLVIPLLIVSGSSLSLQCGGEREQEDDHLCPGFTENGAEEEGIIFTDQLAG